MQTAVELRGTTLDPRSSIAIEQTIRLKEKFGCRTTTLAAGNEELIHAMRQCLALGIDHAVRINTSSSDIRARWELFAMCVLSRSADLVVCPNANSDLQRCDGPAQLAEICSWPLLPNAESMQIIEQTVRAVCRVGSERLTLQTTLPAVISVHPAMNTPRLPSLSQILKAKKIPIEVVEFLIPQFTETRLSVEPVIRKRQPVILQADDPAAVEEFTRLLRQVL